MKDKRQVLVSTALRGSETCLNDGTKLSADDTPLLLSSLLPGRLYKLNWCLAAGQGPLLEILFSKDCLMLSGCLRSSGLTHQGNQGNGERAVAANAS